MDQLITQPCCYSVLFRLCLHSLLRAKGSGKAQLMLQHLTNSWGGIRLIPKMAGRVMAANTKKDLPPNCYHVNARDGMLNRSTIQQLCKDLQKLFTPEPLLKLHSFNRQQWAYSYEGYLMVPLLRLCTSQRLYRQVLVCLAVNCTVRQLL